MPYPRLKSGHQGVLTAALLVFFGVFAAVQPAHAQVDEIANTLGGILGLLLKPLGMFLNALVSILIDVSSYNDFINSLAVVNGWVVVRDVANMFFIIVFLIIAFGTIIGKEEYHYKKLLPKLLILAVLVNFSRTITGVMIDFAQVIMLTFVNGYKAAAGGNFASMFQITELMKFSRDNCQPTAGNPNAIATPVEVFGAMLLAFVMVLVSVVTVGIIVAVLIVRIVMLWVLIVLSPIAFLAGTFPQGQKYYSQWWEEFKNNVMVGPMLAFFLWLSLVTVGGGNAGAHIAPNLSQPGKNVTFSCSSVGSSEALISYILGIMMLLVGVQMAQSMGGAIGGIAGQGRQILSRMARAGVKGTLGAAVGAASFLERKQFSMTGVGLNPVRAWTKLKAHWELRKKIEEAEGAGIAGARAEAWAAKGGAGWGMAAIGAKAMGAHADFFSDYLGWRGVKRVGGAISRMWKEPEKLRDEAKELREKRTLMRTQADQNKANADVTNLDARIADDTRTATGLALGRSGDVIDLDDLKNLEFVREYLKNLKAQEKELKESGRTTEADRIKDQADVIRGALDAGGTFDFSGLDADVKKGFEGGIDATIESLKHGLKTLEDKKLKLQGEITAATSGGLVFATEDEKKKKVKEISEQINKKEQAAAFRTPPRAFYAAENFRVVEAEERKKMPSHSLEATEVVEQFQAALAEGNKVKAMAWLKKATEDYNDNEIFNGLGYDGGYEGIVKFTNEVLIKKLGMKEQEAFSHMSDINYMNEEKGHYNASRMFSVENGVYILRTPEQQATAVLNENLKKNSRKFCQDTNRLGYGYETPDGKYRLDKSGLGTIVAMQGEIINRINRGEFNLSSLNKFGDAMDQLVELEKKGLMTSRNNKGENLVKIVAEAKRKGPLEEGASYSQLGQLVGKIRNI
ncbi:hypothetical protein HY477_00715 [Candidatus Uhrbacteria bacterium]|nr:hypothetical protein [Candidatus Uhrbacteria bacterium]